MKLIPLTQGKFAQVDDHWFDYLMQWKWCANKNNTIYYAQRSEKIDGKWVAIKMHRVIMKTPPELMVDHIDHNGLNNLEENMRNCTNKQNSANKTAYGKSKYLGVCYISYFGASIRKNNKTFHLGHFKTEEEAAKAYDKAAKELYGEFANLNFKE